MPEWNRYVRERLASLSLDDGAATVALRDASGRKRIVMEVQADGTSSLTFLDANGQVVNTLGPNTLKRSRYSRGSANDDFKRTPET